MITSMAVVSRVGAAISQQQGSPIGFSGELRVSSDMSLEIVEDPVAAVRVVVEEKVYVAVSKVVKECKSVLIYALQESRGKRVCIVHIHQPAQMIPLLGARFPVSTLKDQEVKAYREVERQDMLKMLDEYLQICHKMGVQTEKHYVENNSVEAGIIDLISKLGIKDLIMGGAADKRYSRSMTDLKSKKAIAVRGQAPISCQIQFVCKGRLIHTRRATSDGADTEASSMLQQATPNLEIRQSNPVNLRSQSVGPKQTSHMVSINPSQAVIRRTTSTHVNGGSGIASIPPSPEYNGSPYAPWSRSDVEGSLDECDMMSRRSPSQVSVFSSCSSTGMSTVPSVPSMIIEGGEVEPELDTMLPSSHHSSSHHLSPPSVLGGTLDDPLYDQLQQATAEAVNLKQEALQEAMKRAKAERKVIEAIRKVRALESLYAEESKQRKEMEEELMKEKEALEKLKMEQNEVLEQLRDALDQKSMLENRIKESDLTVKELEQKIISAVELLQNYKNEQEELQKERDIAIKEAQELRTNQTESSSAHMRQFFSDFSFAEIEEATRHFDPSLKIGEGGYGSIYKGYLRHTEVAIKMLHSNSLQGPAEFRQEVEVLSNMRHPNLVTLVGACPEAWTLIYEYLPNGSLEDRLSCLENSPPLSWQIRIRIASELCSVLIFLHSSKPLSIVHGDLKPANILLDANFVSKLSDFGICRLLSQNESSSNNTTLLYRTDPKGTFAYMDPEFLASGELTPKSDVYSFGITLLRLLTGRPALGIIKDVRYALDKGNLKDLLDPLAGDWPFVLAEQLAHLALRCCEMNRRSRPDLASEVWRVLEPMKASCRVSSCFQLGSEEHCEPPSYFICPVFQEIMLDPHVAADGFTYEAEALKGWLDSGHDTSPMTNLKLAHYNLVPNRALRSAIQEWLQHQ